MSCYVSLKDPDINEKWFVAMSSVYAGKGKLYAFLYIPDKPYAICTKFKRTPLCQRLTQEAFAAQMGDFKKHQIRCVFVKEVRVACSQAEKIEGEETVQVLETIINLSRLYFKITRAGKPKNHN